MIGKKGQAVTFGSAPQLILLFVVIVLISGAGAVALSSFQTGLGATTVEYNVTGNGLTGLKNFSLQTPTIGTMLGVGLILVVVIGVFAYFARR